MCMPFWCTMTYWWRFRRVGREEVHAYLFRGQSVNRKLLPSVPTLPLLQIQELFLCAFCQVCHSWLISISHLNKDVKMLLLLRTPGLFGIYLYGNNIDLGKFHNNFNLMLATSLLVVLRYLWILASDNFLAGFYYASCWWTWTQVLFEIYRKGE